MSSPSPMEGASRDVVCSFLVARCLDETAERRISEERKSKTRRGTVGLVNTHRDLRTRAVVTASM